MTAPRRRVADGATAIRPSALADLDALLETDERDWGTDARLAGLHRVQAAVIPANAASRGVMRRAGLRHEGLARYYLEIAGAWQDHEIFAATVEDGGDIALPSIV